MEVPTEGGNRGGSYLPRRLVVALVPGISTSYIAGAEGLRGPSFDVFSLVLST